MLWYVSVLFLHCLYEICSCFDYESDVLGPDRRSGGLFEQTPNTELQEDIKIFREMLPDSIEKDSQADTSRFLQQTVNDEYAMLISNLAEADDQSFIAKVDAIRRALEMAFLKTSGVVDTVFVDGVIKMIKSEVEQKRKLNFGQMSRGPLNPYSYPIY